MGSVWRVERRVEGGARGGAGPSQKPSLLPSVPGPDTRLDIALPGHVLTLLQGPLARSVLAGGCGRVSGAGTFWLGWLRRARGPQRLWTCFGALATSVQPRVDCARHWAGSVADEGSSQPVPPQLSAWWPGRVWSRWGLPNRRPPSWRGSAPFMRKVSVCLTDRAGLQWGAVGSWPCR